MLFKQTLTEYLSRASHVRAVRTDVGDVIQAMAAAATEIAALITLGPLVETLDEGISYNADLERRAHIIVMDALKAGPVAAVLSEAAEEIESLDPKASLAVAVDPLDGSSNINTNITIGTIFSIRHAGQAGASALGAFGAAGTRQLAAGIFVYGPQTTLALTLGNGVDIFTLDPRDGKFKLTRSEVHIRQGAHEYAINASNYRHWESPVRIFIDDCLNGAVGLRGTDFNMRWIASLVAETFRVLSRGGIFLYPADSRAGYENGRQHLLYEAAPIAFIVEQAGGRATTGRGRILDIVPTSLHQRVPLIFGSDDAVLRLEMLHEGPNIDVERSQLFPSRSLFRTGG
jgi:fructose-1,6-bisphosphatase I